MNLYLIQQSVNNGYDSYDSAVVVAETAEKAKLVHPSTGISPIKSFSKVTKTYIPTSWIHGNYVEDDWAYPKDITVKFIGICSTDNAYGDVICASFNAG